MASGITKTDVDGAGAVPTDLTLGTGPRDQTENIIATNLPSVRPTIREVSSYGNSLISSQYKQNPIPGGGTVTGETGSSTDFKNDDSLREDTSHSDTLVPDDSSTFQVLHSLELPTASPSTTAAAPVPLLPHASSKTSYIFGSSLQVDSTPTNTGHTGAANNSNLPGAYTLDTLASSSEVFPETPWPTGSTVTLASSLSPLAHESTNGVEVNTKLGTIKDTIDPQHTQAGDANVIISPWSTEITAIPSHGSFSNIIATSDSRFRVGGVQAGQEAERVSSKSLTPSISNFLQPINGNTNKVTSEAAAPYFDQMHSAKSEPSIQPQWTRSSLTFGISMENERHTKNGTDCPSTTWAPETTPTDKVMQTGGTKQIPPATTGAGAACTTGRNKHSETTSSTGISDAISSASESHPVTKESVYLGVGVVSGAVCIFILCFTWARRRAKRRCIGIGHPENRELLRQDPNCSYMSISS